MNEPMHDLLAAAVDRRADTFAEGRAFADAHERRVVRAIRGRRVAATAGIGAVAAALVGAAGYGIATWSDARHDALPGGNEPHVVQAAIETELLPLPTNGSGVFEYYVDSGAIGMEPSAGTGMFLPGAPSASILVTVYGDSASYDLTAPGAQGEGLAFFDMGSGDQQSPSDTFDVVGDVTSSSPWGVHFYLVEGRLITLEEGRSRADAVEVTAMTASDGPAAPASPIVTDIVPLMTDFPDWYYFYVTFGATDLIPFNGGGITPPDAPDVPSDAILVWIHGGPDGYDLTAPGMLETDGYFGVFDADGSMGDADAPTFDVIGNVTSKTNWGVHFYLVDDHLVTLAVGRSRADSVEVTAMLGDLPAPEDLATPFSTTLIPVPLDASYWQEGNPQRVYVFYASQGATDMIPNPYSGFWYPGIPDVPSDAVLVVIKGDTTGFDRTTIGADEAFGVEVGPAWTDNFSPVGNRDSYDFQWTADGQNASINWDVFGDVTDHTRWGVHSFLIDGNLVTEVEGRANPDAIEVTAMFAPESFTASQ